MENWLHSKNLNKYIGKVVSLWESITLPLYTSELTPKESEAFSVMKV